jgi:hypothetical protein
VSHSLSLHPFLYGQCLRERAGESDGAAATVAASTAQQQQQQPPVVAVIGSANHKTGSKQLVCLGKAVQAAVQANVTIKASKRAPARLRPAGPMLSSPWRMHQP